MTENVKLTKFKGIQKNMVRFFKEVRHELRKVIWPNKQQLTNNTVTVLLSCLVIGAIIWVVDIGLVKVSEFVFIKK